MDMTIDEVLELRRLLNKANSFKGDIVKKYMNVYELELLDELEGHMHTIIEEIKYDLDI